MTPVSEMAVWLVTLKGTVRVSAENAEAAIEAAERLVLDGWAPSVNICGVEPCYPSMEKVLDEEEAKR